MHVLMAMGVPTVMFWQSESWVQHPEAEAAFEGLRATKILFHDPVAAANHVAAVHNDPTVWWEQTDVREARSRWNRQFALTDRTWRRKWLAWLLKD
jgi:putative transferase (TIGR04331 family)